MAAFKFRGDSMNLNLCTTTGAVAATVFMILCTLFTLAAVEFGVSSSPERILDRLLGTGQGQITEDASWDSYTTRNLSPPSQVPENITSNGVESQLESPGEITLNREPSTGPSSATDGDHVEMVETAPTPKSAGSDLDDEETVADSAQSLDEDEFDESGDWESPAPESSVSEEFAERSQQLGAVSTQWNYDVCLFVSMGRSGSRTDRRALPYSDLYKLFNAAKSLKKRRVFVGTDSDPTIFCKMVRDFLSPAAECANFSRVTTNKCEYLVVGTTERYTPQPSPSELHEYGFQWGRLESVDLDKEDPARKSPSLPESEWRPTVVTAFSSNHVEVGLLLLRSLGRVAAQQSEFNVSVVVWTMNHFPSIALKALACVVAELETVYKVQTEVRAFAFNAWPSWMHINQRKGYNGGRGEYAWKAVMIHTVLVERGFIYWADAGDRFKTVAGLTQTLQNVKETGFASRHSSGQLEHWTHPMQLEYFGANNESHIKEQHNCDASSIGFTLQSYSKLVRPWYECSITRQCIAPDGSSRRNHRQDQSALTVLAVLAGVECEGVDFGILRNMDTKPNSYGVGVDSTKCYKDPLNLKWEPKSM